MLNEETSTLWNKSRRVAGVCARPGNSACRPRECRKYATLSNVFLCRPWKCLFLHFVVILGLSITYMNCWTCAKLRKTCVQRHILTSYHAILRVAWQKLSGYKRLSTWICFHVSRIIQTFRNKLDEYKGILSRFERWRLNNVWCRNI